ncbi:CCA tRNA nucleotidyltransferase [Sandaracinobacter sp. RS1-74]|uniref:CCA tRNA nucleotidyltransferase n=1 Tax=Sandaracinobacteroides sayramensis TaxID=2913411 RepID=UPI001EDA425E|nr:CCA tRNA nucleotidyltransferase [Sandaracinobacteroides sayramensis]MCG2841519.1 CCA tRNA nucleotidyltransferase [Sandaracinobacteroides sayramensis]
MTRLDPALWIEKPGFRRLLKVLRADAGETRLVGGSVRDWLLGQPAADMDLATRLTPEEVMAALEAADIRAVPTGLKHGTVTAVCGQTPYEITTLRRDVESFGRHAEVAFTQDWRDDAARRDFTINALYADPLTGEIHDWFGGLEDLAARRVRFIGAPLERIAEDHLRILRFFRFSARFAPTLDPEGLEACAQRANDLMALSRERIRDELLKLLALPTPVPTLAAMLEQNILRPVLPEIEAARLADLGALIEAEAQAHVAGDGLRRLAALLPADPKLAAEIGARLKLSNADKARLTHAARREPTPQDPRALAYSIGPDSTLDRLLLTHDPRAHHWAGPLCAYVRPRLPVSGKDLIAMGLPPGPAVSRRLAEVERRWVESGFPADRNRTMAIAREVMGIR